ncbi:Endo-1,3(4)-beta-glucanase [Phytophthora cactorum]|nr:Endo-1,3(4)-beta-glucanase [Phytophthora cactorum]
MVAECLIFAGLRHGEVSGNSMGTTNAEFLDFLEAQSKTQVKYSKSKQKSVLEEKLASSEDKLHAKEAALLKLQAEYDKMHRVAAEAQMRVEKLKQSDIEESKGFATKLTTELHYQKRARYLQVPAIFHTLQSSSPNIYRQDCRGGTVPQAEAKIDTSTNSSRSSNVAALEAMKQQMARDIQEQIAATSGKTLQEEEEELRQLQQQLAARSAEMDTAMTESRTKLKELLDPAAASSYHDDLAVFDEMKSNQEPTIFDSTALVNELIARTERIPAAKSTQCADSFSSNAALQSPFGSQQLAQYHRPAQSALYKKWTADRSRKMAQLANYRDQQAVLRAQQSMQTFQQALAQVREKRSGGSIIRPRRQRWRLPTLERHLDDSSAELETMLLDDNLAKFLESDNARLVTELSGGDKFIGKEAFLILPTRDSIEWQFINGVHYAQVAGFDELPSCCGVKVNDNAFALWWHNLKESTLYVSRARFPDSGDNAAATTRVLLNAALQEARKFKLKKVVIWDPPSGLVRDELDRQPESDYDSQHVEATTTSALTSCYCISASRIVLQLQGSNRSSSTGACWSTIASCAWVFPAINSFLFKPHLSFRHRIRNQEHQQPTTTWTSMKISASALIGLGAVLQHLHLAAVAGQDVDKTGSSSFSDDSPVVAPTFAPVVNDTVPEAGDVGFTNSSVSEPNVGDEGSSGFRALEPPSSLVEHTDAMMSLCPPRFLDSSVIKNRAIPTNNWWGNIIAHDSNAAIQPIWSNPYSLQMVVDKAPFGMSVSYPYRSRFSGGSSGNNGAVKFYAHVTVKFTAGSSSGTMVSDLVSGMVYSSMKYSGLTPRLVSSAVVSTINGQPLGGQVRGSKFEIVYNSGQKWVVYALSSDGRSEKEITLTADGTSALKSTGLLRVKWKTTGDCSCGLLHYAMKHHAETIDMSSGVRQVDGMVAYSTTRGAYQAFTTPGGSADPVWEMKETQQVPEDFYPSRKIASNMAQQQRIVDHLREDINAGWSIPLDGSYYFNGKAAQKYASLCLIANDPAIVGGDKSLLNSCLNKLRGVMAPFVANTWANKLQYDQIYGGVVSSQGFKTKDLNADFGNTMYNDHHFHYGYWVHTAAIINRLDPSWSDLPKLNTMVNLLVRDVANFDPDDKFFARFRSFDCTSEDVNFAFGMYMYGKATNNAAMEAVGKLMTRVNAHAIKTYFLIEDANQIHPANFRPNKVTGIFFDNKVDYATWFSAEKYCIHGIQMIPVSAVTEFVRTKQFVKEEWEQVLGKETIVTREDTGNAWLSLLYANFAMVDKQRALGVLQKAKMDDGLSRSWALYMASSFAE